MNVGFLTEFLLWCTVLNYGVLLLWFLGFVMAHDWLYSFHNRWFQLPVAQFNAIHYSAMAGYKLGIFLLNLGPYVALRIIE